MNRPPFQPPRRPLPSLATQPRSAQPQPAAQPAAQPQQQYAGPPVGYPAHQQQPQYATGYQPEYHSPQAGMQGMPQQGMPQQQGGMSYGAQPGAGPDPQQMDQQYVDPPTHEECADVLANLHLLWDRGVLKSNRPANAQQYEMVRSFVARMGIYGAQVDAEIAGLYQQVQDELASLAAERAAMEDEAVGEHRIERERILEMIDATGAEAASAKERKTSPFPALMALMRVLPRPLWQQLKVAMDMRDLGEASGADLLEVLLEAGAMNCGRCGREAPEGLEHACIADEPEGGAQSDDAQLEAATPGDDAESAAAPEASQGVGADHA